MKRNIICLVGLPGVGKTYFCDYINSVDDSMLCLKIGETLRQSNDSRIVDLLNSGRLIPNDVIYDLIDDALRKHDTINSFVLDGFPREKQQLLWLLQRCYKHNVHVLYLKTRRLYVKLKLLNRFTCKKCHKNNNKLLSKVCVNCNDQKKTYRQDDSSLLLRKRIVITQKIIDEILKLRAAFKTFNVIRVQLFYQESELLKMFRIMLFKK